MLLDATLLALALTYQFRLGQTQRDQAEKLARNEGVSQRGVLYLTCPAVSLRSRPP